MKNFKKLIITGLFLITGMSTNLFCAGGTATFKNTLDEDVTYTGPSHTYTIAKNSDDFKINMNVDSISYTLKSSNLSNTVNSTAQPGKKYKIYKDDKILKVKTL